MRARWELCPVGGRTHGTRPALLDVIVQLVGTLPKILSPRRVAGEENNACLRENVRHCTHSMGYLCVLDVDEILDVYKRQIITY